MVTLCGFGNWEESALTPTHAEIFFSFLHTNGFFE